MRRAGQLQFCLVDVVEINVRVAKSVDKSAGFEASYLGHHRQQQRVGSDIKRYAQEHIGAALVHLARELPIGHIN